jgi:hypothetical protein
MTTFKAAPAFGGKHNTPAYYATLDSIIAVLRPASSLRLIANHLNAHGFKTPTNLDWSRDRAANYIRHKSF